MLSICTLSAGMQVYCRSRVNDLGKSLNYPSTPEKGVKRVLTGDCRINEYLSLSWDGIVLEELRIAF